MRLSSLSCCVWLACTGLVVLAMPVGAGDVVTPGPQLVVEGIPEIDGSLVDAVGRYTESRGATSLDWHPTEREMLIRTRFGETPQVHRVRQPLGDRYQLTFFREPVGGADYDPKAASYLLLSRDRGGDEFWQLYRQDLGTGDVTLLTDGERSQNGGWLWNRARNVIAYTSTRRTGSDRDVWLMNPADSATDRLLVANDGGSWSVTDWSPDDDALLLRENLSVSHSRLYVVDLNSGERRRVSRDDVAVAYGSAQYGPHAGRVYVTSDRDDEFLRLAELDLASGAETPLPIDIQWDVEQFRVSPDRKWLAFVVNAGGASELFVLDTATHKTRWVDGWPLGTIGLGAWRPDSSEFAISFRSARQTSDVYSVDAATLEVTRWTESELGGLNPDTLAEAERIEWESFDGQKISGFLYRPLQAEGPRPVIIHIHGGPEGQSRPGFLGRENYFINELGVALIYPNVRGSTGFGKTYHQLDNGLLREGAVHDIGSLLDWIAKQPDLDADRVMITGGSYGGFMTLACAVQYNDRIRCSLDVVGISHFGTFLKNTESYRRDRRRVEYGDERDPDMAAFFDRIAPLNHADKITKPLFIVQGGNDPRVPASESQQMVERVRANGAPVWYLMARDEGHGFQKKSNSDFQFYATVLFVKSFLLGEAGPAPVATTPPATEP